MITFSVPQSAWARADRMGARAKLTAIDELMKEANAFLADPKVSDDAKRAFLARITSNPRADVDDSDDPGAIGRLFSAVMTDDDALMKEMILDEDGGAFDDALEIGELADLGRHMRMELSAQGARPYLGATPSSWEDAAKLFATPEFISRGGPWFAIPPDVKLRALAAGPEAVKVVDTAEKMAGLANAFLSRDDVSLEEKRQFMALFMSDVHGDYDDENDAGSAGRILAGLMSRDPEVLETMIDGGSLDLEEATKVYEKLEEDFREWRSKNGIERPDDPAGWDRLADGWEQERAAREKIEAEIAARRAGRGA